jgi:hypothetical protein
MNPALAFVMGGALIVAFTAFRLAKRQAAPLFGPRFLAPGRTATEQFLR